MSTGVDPRKGSGTHAVGVRLSGSERKRLAAGGDDRLAELPTEGSIDPATWFEVRRPVELEIGCGKGAFLVRAAEMYPDVNFAGIELVGPIARVAAMRLARRELDNATVRWGDAKAFVTERLEAETLAALHVFFPDPWHKKRHRKRRVFDSAFLAGVERGLVPGGMLCLATDYSEYFESMCSLVDSHPSFESCLSYELTEAEGVTNFERKYLAAGRKSFRASYRKRSQRK